MIDMAEYHLLIDVVYASWVVANARIQGIVFYRDERLICVFFGFSSENCL